MCSKVAETIKIVMTNERFFSNLNHVIIPLYGFEHFHQANTGDEKSDEFIGRDSIIDKLSSWLKEAQKKHYHGAYLITGYRGMGKSMFVHKAIKEMQWPKYSPKKYIEATVNVGNELLSAKDLLGMICKVAAKEYNKAVSRQWLLARLNTIFCIIVLCFGLFLLEQSVEKDYVNASHRLLEALISKNMGLWTIYAVFAVLFLSSGWLSNLLLNFLWRLTGIRLFLTVAYIKHCWENVIERIDAEVRMNSEAEMATTNPMRRLGFSLKYGKTTSYPIAGVPELQEMLVDLLDMVQKHQFTHFRFIFVVDELDKISPKDEERPLMPEYNTKNIANGGSSNSSRQIVLFELLANMKYFISSSNAKFVFVAGYDMYEATLADMSNREFNIHSIFNGHLNVSSFYRRTGNFSGVDSMIEQYLCHLLIDKRHRKRNAGLNDYSHYCRSSETYSELTEDSPTRKTYESILERRIVFLHNYLTYLVYMSNGSPKKLAMYIEKFVRTRDRVKSKMLDDKKTLGEDYDIHFGKQESRYYLYFDSRNVQRICFVNYLIYPMIQNLVDKSNIYNDKLLVSTSFMISNLYKFHKSGFSMRNLEYMPELLDINKMPELRDFIGGILDFLTQTHVDETVVNLYKYKFPLRLSEEITFFSKTSEEISYLFNFSHDELLSVKTLYMRQLEHYTAKRETHAVASLHHMLGDIYMLEEDYELAIYEFQEALSALLRQVGGRKGVFTECPKDTSRLLFYVRVCLKLGLAYEKRKTYDTAYLTYQQLVSQLLRYIEKVGKSAARQDMHFLRDVQALFFNIRIVYLVPLAKLFVLEKMDLGGLRDIDLKDADEEFEKMSGLVGSVLRPLQKIDYSSKLGDILYYRSKFVAKAKDISSTCSACLRYDKAIRTIMVDVLGESKNADAPLIVLDLLLNKDRDLRLQSLGGTMLSAMAKTFLGQGNCFLGCSGEKCYGKQKKTELYEFFDVVSGWVDDYMRLSEMRDNVVKVAVAFRNRLNLCTAFMKSILNYWTSAMLYEKNGEYKSAYTVYGQVLDALYTYLSKTNTSASEGIIHFCEFIALKSIQDAYKHYGHINTAEIDKIKHRQDLDLIADIHLDDLSNSPDIEIILYKYYHICFLSNNLNLKHKVLRNVLKARQLGCEKIISSLVQNIENLSFKEQVNEQLLFMLMPRIRKAFVEGKHDVQDTLCILDGFLSDNSFLEMFMENLNWSFLTDNVNIHKYDEKEKRLQLLVYLVTDSLFCLNKITDIVSPLYSTTLYNNMYIAECYEKEYVWNHILICLREIFYYMMTEKEERQTFVQGFQDRFRHKFDEEEIIFLFQKIANQIEPTSLWTNSINQFKLDKNDSPVKKVYDRICPSAHRYLTSSYLIGNAIDFYHRAVEMHTCGKAYKEMMRTLYFLEDDLSNDSYYLNFATELFCLNKGYIEKKIKLLEKSYYRNKALFNKNNYLNE